MPTECIEELSAGISSTDDGQQQQQPPQIIDEP